MDPQYRHVILKVILIMMRLKWRKQQSRTVIIDEVNCESNNLHFPLHTSKDCSRMMHAHLHEILYMDAIKMFLVTFAGFRTYLDME